MRIGLIIILLLRCAIALPQHNEYRYARELNGVTGQWHSVDLPDELFGSVSHDLSDIRILGISKDGDTTEVPYLHRILNDKKLTENHPFKLINTSVQGDTYFFTLEVDKEESIDRLVLDFEESNFDRKLKLEGSMDQKSWFTIVDDYRIASIKNELTDYRFTTLKFPPAKYRYVRISIPDPNGVKFRSAKVSSSITVKGSSRSHQLALKETNDAGAKKQTELIARLNARVPISRISIEVKDTTDYYRPFKVEYVEDSVITKTGVKYRYRTLISGTLSSLEDNTFDVPETILGRLKITVENHDNVPLSIESVSALSNVHQLVGRFPISDQYFLVYGKMGDRSPNYDLSHFTDQIPDSTAALLLGNVTEQPQTQTEETKPLFENKFWLWAIMGVTVVLLGWFTLKMLRSE